MPRSGPTTRQRILDAAYAQFHRKGFARVNLGDIAKAAAVTKRTLYYHFRSKDDLLAYVLEVQHHLAIASFRNWASRLSGNPEKLVEQMFAELLSWTRKPSFAGSGFTRVVIELADLPGHPARAIARRHKMMVEGFIADLFAEAGLASPRDRAREVYMLLEGATALILAHGDRGYSKSGAEAAKAIIRQPSVRKSHRSSPLKHKTDEE